MKVLNIINQGTRKLRKREKSLVLSVHAHLMCLFLFSPERIFEDHENLVENLLNWTRDSTNRLMFIERIEKYALFKNPQVTCTLIQSVFVTKSLKATEITKKSLLGMDDGVVF